MGDNSGAKFKKLVNDICKDEAIADILLGTDKQKRDDKLDPEVRQKRSQQPSRDAPG